MANDRNSNLSGKKPYTRIHRDYFVTINDKFVLEGPKFNAPINLSDDVENISINYNIDTPPSTCDITIRIPRHKIKGVSKNYKEPLFEGDFSQGILGLKEFDNVKVYAKNRFKFEDGNRGYSLIFEGLVTRVVETEESLNHQVVLNCQDYTYWLHIMRINVNPSFMTRNTFSINKNINPQKTLYGKLNPFQSIIYILNTYTTDFSITGPAVVQDSVSQANKDSSPYTKKIMEVWQKRFNDPQDGLKSRIQIFGYDSTGKGDKAQSSSGDNQPQKQEKSKDHIINNLKMVYLSNVPDKVKQSTSSVFDIALNEDLLNGFKPYSEITVPNVFEDEFRSRLEAILEIAKYIGFEFFQQPSGIITFKPPFYNVYIDSEVNPIYVLKEKDIRSAEYSSDATEVVTEITATGTYDFQLASNEELNNFTFAAYRDPVLAAQYGIVSQALEFKWATNGQQALVAAAGELDRINAKRHQSSITIEGRPELCLGTPIYIPHRDEYYYVRSMSHSISAGSFTTSLNLDSRRRRFINEQGEIGRNQVAVSKLVNNQSSVDEQNQNPSTSQNVNKNNNFKDTRIEYGPQNFDFSSPTSDKEKVNLEKENTVTNISTILIGTFPDFVEDAQTQEIKVEEKSMRVPVSDSRGYEVIGAFKYGRGYIINEKGRVVRSSGSSSSSLQDKTNNLTNMYPRDINEDDTIVEQECAVKSDPSLFFNNEDIKAANLKQNQVSQNANRESLQNSANVFGPEPLDPNS